MPNLKIGSKQFSHPAQTTFKIFKGLNLNLNSKKLANSKDVHDFLEC